MGNYDSVELHGEERERELVQVQKKISEWGLTMPL